MTLENLSENGKEETGNLMETLARACRILGGEGHDNLTLGHVSTRTPDPSNAMVIKGRGLCLSEIQDQDLVTIDFNYQKVAGRRDPHSELPIHVEIYKRRPDVNCVIHTHPTYATAFSASRQPLRPINNIAAYFSGSLAYFDATTDLIVTPEAGTSVAEALGDANALILKNHGIVVSGETIQDATVRAYLLEESLKGLYIANVYGELTWSSEDDAMQKVAKGFSQSKIRAMWAALLRRLERREAPLRILAALEGRG